MRRHIVYCTFLWVTPATKPTKFGSRYLEEGLSERDENLQVARGWLVYPTTQTGDLGNQNIEGRKNYGNVFSKVVSPLSIKIGMMGEL